MKLLSHILSAIIGTLLAFLFLRERPREGKSLEQRRERLEKSRGQVAKKTRAEVKAAREELKQLLREEDPSEAVAEMFNKRKK